VFIFRLVPRFLFGLAASVRCRFETGLIFDCPNYFPRSDAGFLLLLGMLTGLLLSLAP